MAGVTWSSNRRQYDSVSKRPYTALVKLRGDDMKDLAEKIAAGEPLMQQAMEAMSVSARW